LQESDLAEKDLDQLAKILNAAIKINAEYEDFLKMAGLERANYF
jgi:hypothetical protein